MKVKYASQRLVVQRSQNEDKLSKLNCKAKKENKKEVESESETCKSTPGSPTFTKGRQIVRVEV